MDAQRVLIVEDDPDLQAALETTLAAQGYDVSVASNGADAIEILSAGEPPSAVIVDLLMPGVVGQELLEFLRAEDTLAGVRVAIVTGSPRLAPEGYTVFAKPVDAERLLRYLRGDDTRGDNVRGGGGAQADNAPHAP